jgi:hypothetical protein
LPSRDKNSLITVNINCRQKIYKEDIELEEGKYFKEAFITSNETPIALAKLEGKYIIPFRVFNN